MTCFAFFTPVDLRAPLWNASRYKNISLGCCCCFLERVLGCVPLGGSGSGFTICGVPLEQIHFQISDLSNPLWTRIHRSLAEGPAIKYFYWRFSTVGTGFSRFSRHFYSGVLFKVKMEKSVQTLIDLLLIFLLFELCFGWEKSSLPSLRVLAYACPCDPLCLSRHQYGGAIDTSTSGKQ